MNTRVAYAYMISIPIHVMVSHQRNHARHQYNMTLVGKNKTNILNNTIAQYDIDKRVYFPDLVVTSVQCSMHAINTTSNGYRYISCDSNGMTLTYICT